jgi:hypothetical protein
LTIGGSVLYSDPLCLFGAVRRRGGVLGPPKQGDIPSVNRRAILEAGSNGYHWRVCRETDALRA